MSKINFKDMSFNYNGSYENIFEDVNVSIDTNWKTAIIGRNGRGKTTLLRLINKQYKPSKGTVEYSGESSLFPVGICNKSDTTINIIKDIIGNYRILEEKIDKYLRKDISEEEYLVTLQEFLDIDGYNINFLIEREIEYMGLKREILERSYDSLSGGEQTKIQIIALFLQKNNFILLDEPTNHLDVEGIEVLLNYLKNKSGFIIVSHNRYFLDALVDHVLYINKNSIGIEKGNYSSWEKNEELKIQFEKRKKEKIEKEVKELEKAARQKRTWSFKREKEKIGSGDKGFEGARAARIMKRAILIEGRIEENLNAKKELLKDYERERKLKFESSIKGENILLVSNITVLRGNKKVINDLSFNIRKGERVAIKGPNGSGKTTLLYAILGILELEEGIIKFENRSQIVYASQFPKWTNGFLREHLKSEKIDETRFRSILGCMGSDSKVFERDLSTFSVGELKKVDLAYCFYKDDCFQIWDEPLNGLDIESRKLIEKAILDFKPTILFVEHDKSFIENISTKIIDLNINY